MSSNQGVDLDALERERQRDKYLATDAAIERLERYLADPANWPVEYPVTIRGTIQRMREAEKEREGLALLVGAYTTEYNARMDRIVRLERVREAAQQVLAQSGFNNTRQDETYPPQEEDFPSGYSELRDSLAAVQDSCQCGHLRSEHRADEPDDHEECGRCDCTDFVFGAVDDDRWPRG